MDFFTPDESNHIVTSTYYRGLFITKFAAFEKSLDYTLTNYFTENEEKKIEMMQIIFERMTFESKRASLKALFDKRAKSNGFVKTKNNKYPHNELFEEIRRLNDHRNYFAHYIMMPILEDKIETEVLNLVSVRDGIETKVYSEQDITNLLNKLDFCVGQLMDFVK